MEHLPVISAEERVGLVLDTMLDNPSDYYQRLKSTDEHLQAREAFAQKENTFFESIAEELEAVSVFGEYEHVATQTKIKRNYTSFRNAVVAHAARIAENEGRPELSMFGLSDVDDVDQERALFNHWVSTWEYIRRSEEGGGYNSSILDDYKIMLLPTTKIDELATRMPEASKDPVVSLTKMLITGVSDIEERVSFLARNDSLVDRSATVAELDKPDVLQVQDRVNQVELPLWALFDRYPGPAVYAAAVVYSDAGWPVEYINAAVAASKTMNGAGIARIAELFEGADGLDPFSSPEVFDAVIARKGRLQALNTAVKYNVFREGFYGEPDYNNLEESKRAKLLNAVRCDRIAAETRHITKLLDEVDDLETLMYMQNKYLAIASKAEAFKVPKASLPEEYTPPPTYANRFLASFIAVYDRLLQDDTQALFDSEVIVGFMNQAVTSQEAYPFAQQGVLGAVAGRVKSPEMRVWFKEKGLLQPSYLYEQLMRAQKVTGEDLQALYYSFDEPDVLPGKSRPERFIDESLLLVRTYLDTIADEPGGYNLDFTKKIIDGIYQGNKRSRSNPLAIISVANSLTAQINDAGGVEVEGGKHETLKTLDHAKPENLGAAVSRILHVLRWGQESQGEAHEAAVERDELLVGVIDYVMHQAMDKKRNEPVFTLGDLAMRFPSANGIELQAIWEQAQITRTLGGAHAAYKDLRRKHGSHVYWNRWSAGYGVIS